MRIDSASPTAPTSAAAASPTEGSAGFDALTAALGLAAARAAGFAAGFAAGLAAGFAAGLAFAAAVAVLAAPAGLARLRVAAVAVVLVSVIWCVPVVGYLFCTISQTFAARNGSGWPAGIQICLRTKQVYGSLRIRRNRTFSSGPTRPRSSPPQGCAWRSLALPGT
ncbi:MAG: hypothetical protein DI533_04795 [Cereibacter sphaeroides]|uniref:Uncharacterized protein n=1 Tax=Cereibacter sphaeroides TaxID=1063 RepID=A0A2W5UQ90_CERSP|nr:MAG: hypothetical protein DI533_04795 [Cereibacter sphaeroides]